MNINFLLNYLWEPISYGLCFAFLLFYASKHRKAKWNALTAYYFLAMLLMFKAAFSDRNIEIYGFLSLLSCVCIGMYFFYTLLARWKKRTVVILGIIQSCYYLTVNVNLPKAQVFDSTGYVILSISIVLMSFMYMHQILTNVTEEPLSHDFNFWFVSAQLVYHLGSFFIFLTYGYLTQKLINSELYSVENRTYLSQLWRVHNVLLFLSAVFLSAGILWISFRRKSPSLL